MSGRPVPHLLHAAADGFMKVAAEAVASKARMDAMARDPAVSCEEAQRYDKDVYNPALDAVASAEDWLVELMREEGVAYFTHRGRLITDLGGGVDFGLPDLPQMVGVFEAVAPLG